MASKTAKTPRERLDAVEVELAKISGLAITQGDRPFSDLVADWAETMPGKKPTGKAVPTDASDQG